MILFCFENSGYIARHLRMIPDYTTVEFTIAR
jgi:hypothetical protein